MSLVAGSAALTADALSKTIKNMTADHQLPRFNGHTFTVNGSPDDHLWKSKPET
jgi:hypothetical protein